MRRNQGDLPQSSLGRVSRSAGRIRPGPRRDVDALSIRPREDRGAVGWLLVTDVDDTLLGDDGALADFIGIVTSTAEIAVVWNSARPIPSLYETMGELRTDWRPFGLVGALGTQIELRGVRLRGWTRRFAGFDRQPIDAVMARMGCEPHREEFQTPFKASFAVPPRLQARAVGLVRETGVPAKIILSGETNFDVIPANAGKGAALRHVREVLGVPPCRTLAAGDSCNDFDMLSAGRAIVVGNAASKLKVAMRETGAYLAERAYAAGIIEGLQYWGAPLLQEIG